MSNKQESLKRAHTLIDAANLLLNEARRAMTECDSSHFIHEIEKSEKVLTDLGIRAANLVLHYQKENTT